MSDTTQSEPSGTAAQITRGVQRFMLQAGLVSLTEVVLPDGHRADIMALDKKGQVTIVEVKSSLADFRSDQKWHAYKDFCDLLFFAVADGFPDEVIPTECGLLRADAYQAIILRAPTASPPLAASRRKSLVTRFGRLAAQRLQLLNDPGCSGILRDLPNPVN